MTPHQHTVILQRQPQVLCRNAAGLLHRDGGPAIQYRDGFTVWALNGVPVPRWLAETPATQIAPQRVLKIQNAETRREFVRKVVLERLCHSLNARCVDKMGDYELLLLRMEDSRFQFYLKMLNPSVVTWHVEGVHPDCRSVAEALAWRNGTSEPPEILT